MSVGAAHLNMGPIHLAGGEEAQTAYSPCLSSLRVGMLHAIRVVLTAAASVFPSCGVASAAQPMTDVVRLSRARARPPSFPAAGLSSSVCVSALCSVRPVSWCVFVSPPPPSHTHRRTPPLQCTDIIKQLAQSFQPQQGKIIQSALSGNTPPPIHYRCGH